MAKAGRPRSAESRCNILKAALRLARTRGYARVTMGAIAAEAGVGKQTIYRWWPSKAAVVLEALRENARMEIDVPDTGSLAEDLEGFLKSTFDSLRRRPGLAAVLRALLAEAQHDSRLARSLRRLLIDPRRATLRALFESAHRRREIPSLADAGLWLDLVFGVFWYRLLVPRARLDDTLARQLAEILVRVSQRPASLG